MRSPFVLLLLGALALEDGQSIDAQLRRDDYAVAAIASAIAHVRDNFIPRKLEVLVLAADRVRSETAKVPPGQADDLGERVAAATRLLPVKLDDVLLCGPDRMAQNCRLRGADAFITGRLMAFGDTTADVIIGVHEAGGGRYVRLLMKSDGTLWKVDKLVYIIYE